MPLETYLINAANEMNLLLSKAPAHPEREQDHLREAAFIACNTLKQLSSDREFYRAVEQLAERQSENASDLDAITGDSAHFESFLRVEREIMIRAGITPELADHLLNKARELIQAVRSHSAEPQEVFAAFNAIRDRVCDLALSLQQQRQDRKTREWSKMFVLRVTFAVGGAALIGLNVSQLAVSLGLTAVGAAVSGAIGSTLIGNAVAAAAAA
jgi:hypothetical protein